MIDAAGAIYVIGGYGNDGNVFNDVWASADGGGHRTRAGCGRGGEGGYQVAARVRARACSRPFSRERETGISARAQTLARTHMLACMHARTAFISDFICVGPRLAGGRACVLRLVPSVGRARWPQA